MRPDHPEESYPLSPMQQGMLFHSLYAPRSGVYIQQLICDMHEDQNILKFQSAWQRMIERHKILRTSFHWEGSAEPFQKVHRDVKLPWIYEDLRSVSEKLQRQRLTAYLENDQRRGFELSEAPLMRLALFRLGDIDFQFIWTYHHALLDGRSHLIVLKEVFACYEAFCQGREIHLPYPRPYRDFIDWLKEQASVRAEHFWRRFLVGFTRATPLVVDRTHNAASDEKGYGTQEVILSEMLTSELHLLARRHQLTPNTLLMGAWALLINRYSGEEDVVFGTTRAGRAPILDKVESMVGLFINTLPMRVRLSPDHMLLPWLGRLRSQWIIIRDYEHSSLGKVQLCSDVPAGKPLFESILIFENYSMDSRLKAQGGSWEHRDFRLRGPTNYPLSVTGYLDRELVLKIEYDRQRFDHATIERMLGHLRTILEGMVADPERRLSELPILTDQERGQLLVEWNDTSTEFPLDQCLHQLFEAQAKKMPDAVAVVFEGAQLTYRELNQHANRLAHRLRKLGVGPETLVGICMERSLEMVVGLLGILKAGGAYVPLDPWYPKERLAFMLRNAQASILLTQRHLAKSLPANDAQVLFLDADRDSMPGEGTENPVSGVTAENLAYVIYTSGSTGEPKGVMVRHRSVCNFLHWRCSYFPLAKSDRLLQKTSLSFDDSVWEFFEPLMVGARLIMARPGGHQDSAYLVKLISEQEITAVSFVPSMLHAFLEEPGVEKLNSLRRVTTGGEVLSVELQERFFAHLAADLYNGYGPTEATIGATFWACKRGSGQRFVPIGRPIANTQIYLLDARLEPVPIGVPGEIYIGGTGLARGYLDQPELTAKRFISHSLDADSGARLYRTGDLARYLPDGNLEFLGRIDEQVKIRGIRVEPGEVEAVLKTNPAVRSAVVVVRGEQLAAYVVFAPGKTVEAIDLRRHAGQVLPEYMVPSVFVALDSVPLTPNGKVDRKALPDPEEKRLEIKGEFEGPVTRVQEILAEIWCEVLGLDRVGIHDNFFDLGGHSLLATRVMSRVRTALKVEMSLRDLFESPTIAGICARIDSGRTQDDAPPLGPARRGSQAPLSR